MSPKPATRSETPDLLDPEWTEQESRWAVNVADFSSLDDATRFLLRRKEIFRAAQEAGFPKDMLSPFEPNKPGFEDRARKALAALNKAMGWAAE